MSLSFTGVSPTLKTFVFSLFLLLVFSGCARRNNSQAEFGSNAAGPLVEYTESFFSPLENGTILYQHQFIYHPDGRIAADKFNYYSKGQLVSTTDLTYQYDEAGRLVARTSPKSQYKYFYNPQGKVSRYEAHFLMGNKWQLLEETSLTEKISGDRKTLHLVFSKKKAGESELRVHQEMKYQLDGSGELTEVQTYSPADKEVKPAFAFTYDKHPNPLQNTFMARLFYEDLENSGSFNIRTRRSTGSSQTFKYTYNASGYPVKAEDERGKTKIFRYQNDQ